MLVPKLSRAQPGNCCGEHRRRRGRPCSGAHAGKYQAGHVKSHRCLSAGGRRRAYWSRLEEGGEPA